MATAAARRMSKDRASKALDPNDEEKKVKREAMDQLELRKLSRESRMMKEVKMKDLVVEKLTKVTNIVKKENDNLVDNLRLVKSTTRCILDAKQAQNIANLFAQGDDVDAAIALEKQYIEDLESQIQKESQNIQSLKKEKGNVVAISDYLAKTENERADRTLETWKSKLAAEQTQLALTTKENGDMRKKLVHLLKEKSQFNKTYEEFMGKLTKGKRIMADIVEQARQEFQKRDEIVHKIKALRSRDNADLAKRMEEMEDLEKKLYEDQKLASFRQRVQMVRDKLQDGIQQIRKDTLEREKLNSKVMKANDFMNRLRETTGLNGADEICDYIKNQEAKLFSLFNFNNEIRDQLEVMTAKTADLVRTVDDEQLSAEERLEHEAKVTNSMLKKMEYLERTHSDMNDLCNANARLFSRLLDKIRILFETMRCDPSPLQDLLGHNKEVTEFNYRLYLNLIETEVINSLEVLTGATQPIQLQKTISAMKPNTPSKSILKSKSIKSVPSMKMADKRLITLPCWE